MVEADTKSLPITACQVELSLLPATLHRGFPQSGKDTIGCPIAPSHGTSAQIVSERKVTMYRCFLTLLFLGFTLAPVSRAGADTVQASGGADHPTGGFLWAGACVLPAYYLATVGDVVYRRAGDHLPSVFNISGVALLVKGLVVRVDDAVSEPIHLALFGAGLLVIATFLRRHLVLTELSSSSESASSEEMQKEYTARESFRGANSDNRHMPQQPASN